jgi:hypothetical protein
MSGQAIPHTPAPSAPTGPAPIPRDPVISPPGTKSDPSFGLTVSQQSAFDLMMAMLNEYNLGSLANVLKGLIVGGDTDPNVLQLKLQDTQEWKTRFAGNEILKQNGLPVMSVGEYLSTERSYAQVMRNYGLPAGFYDDPSDFSKWIGGSVSPNELQQRAQAFADIANREDPAVTAQLQSMGMSQGDILAYIMDPDRAMPLVQKKYQQTILGSAARRAGVVADNSYLGHLADMGISEQQAAQGYGMIGEGLTDMQRMGDIYGEQFGQGDFESAVFDQNADATRKQKRLASRERAEFGGSSGVGRGSLTRQSGGQY